MRKALLTYWIGYLALVLLVVSCNAPERQYNQWKLEAGVEEKMVLRLKMEGPEEKLKGFLAVVRSQLGRPEVTFLHYTLESYAEFFNPEGRALDPKGIISPFGIQKIMVWDSLWVPDLVETPLQVALQIEERQRGKRPIDPYDCEVELRVRTQDGEDILARQSEAARIQKVVEVLSRRQLGAPHDLEVSGEFAAREKQYEKRVAVYADRVAGILSADCYPPVAGLPDGFRMSLQICEIDGMLDTLRGKIAVLDAAGDPIPHVLVDIVAGNVTDTICIMDGMSGYDLYVKSTMEVAEIRFLMQDGRVVVYYERGDFLDNPSPYKQRNNKEYYQRRQRERQEERARARALVVS